MKLTLRTGKSEIEPKEGSKADKAEDIKEGHPEGSKADLAEEKGMKIKVKIKVKNESAKKLAKAMVKKDKKIQKY